MQKYITDVEQVKHSCKRAIGSWSLRRKWNISFVNIVLEIFRICPPNITKLQKTKQDEHFQIYNFFFFKCPILFSDSSTIILGKRKKCPRNIRFLDKFFYKVQKISPYRCVIRKTKKTLQILRLTFSLLQVNNRIKW